MENPSPRAVLALYQIAYFFSRFHKLLKYNN
jgi:hypothetical protein